MTTVTRFAIVGHGWRAQFFLRLAAVMPDRFRVTGIVTRTADGAHDAEVTYGVPSFRTIDDLTQSESPDFVITSVPREVNAQLVVDLVERGIRVLSETPPGRDADDLRWLWSRVGHLELVQVAEQYLLLPDHAARRAVVESGAIGRPTSIQVSSTHDYHAVAMIRGLLGVGFADAVVRATRFISPLSDPLSPSGWADDDTPKELATTIATIDFDGSSGLYDFTDNQWWNPLRSRRIVIRGERGEIVDERVVRLFDAVTPIESHLVRRQTGRDLNLEGVDLHHISLDGAVVYSNEFNGSRLSDEDIAIATVLAATGTWCRDEGAPPYPLAEACQDHLISLAFGEAASSDRSVGVVAGPWARSL